MDRAFKFWIAPSMIGLAVTAALSFLLALLWRTAVVDVDSLVPQVHERAMEDLVYHDRIIAEVNAAADTLLLTVGAVVWLTTVLWFAGCWRKPPAEVGAVLRQRSRWRTTGAAGMFVSFLAAGYFAVWGSQLSSLLALRPLLLLFFFLVPFFCIIYCAVGALGTHRMFLPAITTRDWRPW